MRHDKPKTAEGAIIVALFPEILAILLNIHFFWITLAIELNLFMITNHLMRFYILWMIIFKILILFILYQLRSQ